MATSHAKVCEKGFALCLHKSGSFSRTFIGREPEIAAARSDEAIGMARKENLVKGREPGRTSMQEQA